MDELEIERLGGLAGFGAPGGSIRSSGSVNMSDLSEDDRGVVEALFSRGAAAADAKPDEFVYRITRRSAAGVVSTVEVPASEVPAALRQSVRDELR